MDRVAARRPAHACNPGTTADLTAAAIFVVLLWRRVASANSGTRSGRDVRCSARGDFRVSVTKDYLVFASAHFITFAGHRCEGLHGHNYRARVTIEGALNEESWFVFDFVELKRIMRGCATRSTTWCCCRSQSDRVTVDGRRRDRARRRGRQAALSLPAPDCALLPIPNTTVEMLAKLLTIACRPSCRRPARTRADGDRDGGRGKLRTVGGVSGEHLGAR